MIGSLRTAKMQRTAWVRFVLGWQTGTRSLAGGWGFRWRGGRGQRGLRAYRLRRRFVGAVFILVQSADADCADHLTVHHDGKAAGGGEDREPAPAQLQRRVARYGVGQDGLAGSLAYAGNSQQLLDLDAHVKSILVETIPGRHAVPNLALSDGLPVTDLDRRSGREELLHVELEAAFRHVEDPDIQAAGRSRVQEVQAGGLVGLEPHGAPSFGRASFTKQFDFRQRVHNSTVSSS